MWRSLEKTGSNREEKTWMGILKKLGDEMPSDHVGSGKASRLDPKNQTTTELSKHVLDSVVLKEENRLEDDCLLTRMIDSRSFQRE
jgi:hypothetical protein